jgi:hypothetical protein
MIKEPCFNVPHDKNVFKLSIKCLHIWNILSIFVISITLKTNQTMQKIFYLALCAFSIISINSYAQVDMKLKKPLSEDDAKAVRKILSTYDPNSYRFTTEYISSNGAKKTMSSGKASLASIKQTNTRMTAATMRAGTVNTNNIFKTAGTVNTNNIFKTAGTVNTNNIFKTAGTVNTNNIFKTAGTVNTNNIFKTAGTVNTNNIFKPADVAANELNQLYTILAKYQ